MPITLPYLTRTGSCRYWIWIFFGWSIFPNKMKTTYIAIFPAYKLVTSTACPYPNFSFFVRFLGIWKAIKRYYRSIGLFQTFWISCIAFTSTPSTSLYHLKRYIFICVSFEFTVQIHKTYWGFIGANTLTCPTLLSVYFRTVSLFLARNPSIKLRLKHRDFSSLIILLIFCHGNKLVMFTHMCARFGPFFL